MRASEQTALGLAAVLLLAFAAPSFASVYVTIVGQSEGRFQGETSGPTQDGGPILGYRLYLGSAPGSAGAPRSLVIVKQLDAATRQIVKAAAANEPLNKVVITIYHVVRDQQQVTQTITLTNAAITGVHFYTGSATPGSSSSTAHATGELEQVTLTFSKIEMSNAGAGTSATSAAAGSPS